MTERTIHIKPEDVTVETPVPKDVLVEGAERYLSLTRQVVGLGLFMIANSGKPADVREAEATDFLDRFAEAYATSVGKMRLELDYQG